MTRFVYVLPAGPFRWEVRVALDDPVLLDALDRLLSSYGDPAKPLYYRRKSHALIAARAIAIVIGGEVQPHDRRGRIQDPDSYGNDPTERRG